MKSNKPKPVINKLLHAVRHNRLWRTRKFLDKKRELKKQGVDDEEQYSKSDSKIQES